MNKIIALGGPTASGKSSLAKELVEKFNGEAVSVDSVQAYKGLDIGAGKDKSFPQKMLDILKPGEPISVSEFSGLALKEIEKIHSVGKLPILVGGTGYYLDSLLYEKTFPSATNPKLLEELERFSTETLQERLRKIDTVSAQRTDKNTRRILRALEIVETTGQPVPSQQRSQRFDTCLIILDPGKEIVEENIIKRLDTRLKEGLIDEVRQLKKTVDNNWLATKAGIEYTYGSMYLENKLSYDSMREHIITQSRLYANRQRTWFKRYKEAIWIEKPEEAFEIIDHFIAPENTVQ